MPIRFVNPSLGVFRMYRALLGPSLLSEHQTGHHVVWSQYITMFPRLSTLCPDHSIPSLVRRRCLGHSGLDNASRLGHPVPDRHVLNVYVHPDREWTVKGPSPA